MMLRAAAERGIRIAEPDPTIAAAAPELAQNEQERVCAVRPRGKPRGLFLS